MMSMVGDALDDMNINPGETESVIAKIEKCWKRSLG